MRLLLEGTPEEFEEKRDELVKALVDRFNVLDPDLAGVLEKALPHKEPLLKYRVLRDLQHRTKLEYRATLDKMVTAIGQVLDTNIQKSGIDLQKVGPDSGTGYSNFTRAEGDDPDYNEEGEPILDPKTGLSPSEEQEEKDQGISDVYEDEGEDLEESVQKALSGPYIGPKGGKWADPEHTVSWRQAASGLSKLKEWAKQHGGKLKTHKTDPSMVMVKVPKSAAAELHALKTAFAAEEPIKVGSNYAMLAISTVKMSGQLQKKAPKTPKVKKAPKAKAKFSIPPYAGVPWTSPESVEAAAEWCKGHGIKASFPDLPTAIEVTKALSESHPMVLDHVQFIGTPPQQQAWAKANPENANDPKAKHKVDLAKKSVLSGGSAVAVAHPLTAKPYTRSIIVVKGSYWNETKAQEAKAKSGGFTVSNSLGDTVRHELGHVEAFALRHAYPPESTKSVWEIWKQHVVPQLKKKQVSKDISQYGQTNPHEAWAELAVLRRRGHAVPSWVQKALDAMGVDVQDWKGMTK